MKTRFFGYIFLGAIRLETGRYPYKRQIFRGPILKLPLTIPDIWRRERGCSLWFGFKHGRLNRRVKTYPFPTFTISQEGRKQHAIVI